MAVDPNRPLCEFPAILREVFADIGEDIALLRETLCDSVRPPTAQVSYASQDSGQVINGPDKFIRFDAVPIDTDRMTDLPAFSYLVRPRTAGQYVLFGDLSVDATIQSQYLGPGLPHNVAGSPPANRPKSGTWRPPPADPSFPSFVFGTTGSARKITINGTDQNLSLTLEGSASAGLGGFGTITSAALTAWWVRAVV